MISLLVKDKMVELKFNFKALMKANSTLSTVDNKTNESLQNGASTLFLRLKSEEAKAIVDAIKVTAEQKLTDEAIYEAIEQYGSADEDGYDCLFRDLVMEFEESRFFGKEAVKMKTNLSKTEKRLRAKTNPTVAETQQLEELEAAMALLM